MATASPENLFFVPLVSESSGRNAAIGRYGLGRYRGSRFSHFVGDENNRPVESLLHLDEFPSSFWPLVFEGPSGSGKTSLVEFAVKKIASLIAAERSPSDRPSTLFLTSVDFARGFADAIDTNTLDHFLDRILSQDVVALDDLDELTRFPAAERELVSLLDRLSELQVPVIVSLRDSDRSALSTTLSGRLKAGLVVPVRHPGLAARIHLLTQLAQEHLLELNADELTRLAKRFPLSLPQLLRVMLDLKQKKLAAVNLPAIVSDSLELSLIEKLDLTLQLVADHFSISPHLIRSTSRKQSYVLARNTSIFLARELFDLSYAAIGQYFSGRDHSTILHGYHKITAMAETSPDFKRSLNLLANQLSEKAVLNDSFV